MLGVIRKTWFILDSEGRRALAFLAIGVSALAALETLAMSLVMPFIALVSAPHVIKESRWFNSFMNLVGSDGAELPKSAVVVFGFVLVGAYLFKNAFALLIFWFQSRFTRDSRKRTTIRLHRYLLERPYALSVEKNPIDQVRILGQEIQQAYDGVVLNLLTGLSEIASILAIIGLLFAVDAISTISSILIFGIIGLSFHFWLKTRLSKMGAEFQRSGFKMHRRLGESVDGLKDIIVGNFQAFFEKEFSTHLDINLRIGSSIRLLGELPRFLIEITAVAGLVAIANIILLQTPERGLLVPTLGLFAVASFRILPSLSKLLGCINTINFSIPSLDLIADELREYNRLKLQSRPAMERRSIRRMTYRASLVASDLSFGYPSRNERQLFESISFRLKKNEKLAIIGPSGAGKSTLIDIILGLQKPTKGKIELDGRDIYESIEAWRETIGCVPQTIYLFDDSILNNIVVDHGPEDVDEDVLWQSIRLARLDSFVKSLREGLNTNIGARGVRLSGGQIQRLGIARALFRQPEILIFDEATANLDNETERAIFKDIFELAQYKTLIIVSHKMALVEHIENKIILGS